MHYFFGNSAWRMDWGLGNPNKTAALIAILMIAVWIFAFIRRWGFWPALALFTGLGFCLVHTMSRGGLVALAVGGAVLLIFTRRNWTKLRAGWLLASLSLMFAFSFYLDAHARFAQGIAEEDKSVTNRLVLWAAAPEMMHDAPGGWGLGNSGQAFMNWYQDTDRYERYRTMVNSHLTWLTEFGWPLRFLYLLGWGAVFLLCWPGPDTRWFSVPLAVSVTFFVGAIFSSVAESYWLWIVPGLMLLSVLITRLAKVSWPQPRMFALPSGAAALVLLGFFIVGTFGKMPVRATPDRVIVGKDNPAIWVVLDEAIIGRTYGKELKAYLAENPDNLPALGIAHSLDDLPKDRAISQLILAGELKPEQADDLRTALARAEEVLVLSPKTTPLQLGLEPDDLTNVEVVFGEFSQSPASFGWEGKAPIRRLVGVGDYIPSWPEVVFTQPEQEI